MPALQHINGKQYRRASPAFGHYRAGRNKKALRRAPFFFAVVQTVKDQTTIIDGAVPAVTAGTVMVFWLAVTGEGAVVLPLSVCTLLNTQVSWLGVAMA
jgi:hypothetical protein